METVTDPEVPVLSILDLGIVRSVQMEPDSTEIVITPTYSGCPAMKVIEINILAALLEHQIPNPSVRTILSPAWTTDWMTEAGKAKLKAYGIAPPQYQSKEVKGLFEEAQNIICPLCNSTNSEMLSEFGSTACKSLYRCKDCLEPFDYFKCH